ncbi:hypothetical protein OGY14_00190 [Citrobacter sp. Cpo073]|uniref:hypothetical protein n=1 Tax=Citrobacter sp. Cpo073 TaxID=2985134 RepID=UPI002578FB2D|nr:hypothetical protein [Citrobacter sp. Cpo073]MDM2860625.1 hypothetical protein [Citrobacter sp. Cpo073]
MTALNKHAHQTENERMAQSLAERNGEPVEGLRQRISELEEIATDYGMKFQKAQDALKHQTLLHQSQMKAAENNLIDSECHVAELEESLRDKQALLEALDNSLCELLPGTQYMDPPDGGSVTPLEQVRRMVADYRGRIEELEARELVVKQFDDFQIVHYGATEDYAKGYIDCQNNYNKALAAAGIGVKGE